MNTPLSQCHALLGLRYTIGLLNTTRQKTGRREGAMMLGRDRASVKEGRVKGGTVDEGNERGRDGTRHGWREGMR